MKDYLKNFFCSILTILQLWSIFNVEHLFISFALITRAWVFHETYTWNFMATRRLIFQSRMACLLNHTLWDTWACSHLYFVLTVSVFSVQLTYSSSLWFNFFTLKVIKMISALQSSQRCYVYYIKWCLWKIFIKHKTIFY